MKLDKYLNKVIYVSFLSLGLFPLLKENLSSILIIVCVALTLFSAIRTKKKLVFTRHMFYLSIPFWLFLSYNTFTLEFSSKTILINLPFVIFPFLFYNRPSFINKTVLWSSIRVFQYALVAHLLITTILYLDTNSILDIFKVSNENIPFYRRFFYHENFIDIHPTYFSMFLLFSATVTALELMRKQRSLKYIFVSICHLICCVFFVFLLSSKGVILLACITLVVILIKSYTFLTKAQFRYFILGMGMVMVVFTFTFKTIIVERFDEIRTEYNKPIEGLYFNSTNIRIAIIKCSLTLLESNSVFGYGNNLQSHLNNCYKDSYNSDFYKLGNYNSHNYYLHLLLYGGWLMIIAFLCYVVYIFKRVKYSFLGLVFTGQVLVINLTESFLLRHYGIVFFCFIITIFICLETHKIKNEL